MPPEEPQRPVHESPGPPSWLAPVKPVVPDHELLRRIGGGSYGDVWLARSVVGTWRAVKVVFRDRFLDSRPYDREFKGIQKFEPLSRSNEGFIDILQIGRNDAEGYFYYVMELADDAAPAAKSDQSSVIGNQSVGSKARQPLNTDPCSLNTGLDPSTYVAETLAKALLQRGRLPVGECLELGITLNLALARLHTAGLIHRDIKPSNIIFVGGVPKLADIGLVIEVAEARSYVGTEGFIPPEGPNSPQADLYSLGKVLYEAGMGKDRKDFPEPPTQIAQVPDSAELLEFNAVLLKACAANVKDRYQSAEEMNADLALLQSGGSVRRQRTLTRRLHSVQRAGALVTALAVVIGAGWLWQARETHLVRDLATEKTRLAAEKTQLANENREQLVRLRIANGVRLMDQDDLSGALLWFAEALPLVTNKPAEEAMHRVRIQQVLNQSPRLLHVMSHDASVAVGAFSPDGRRVATGTVEGDLQMWDSESGRILLGPTNVSTRPVDDLRFSKDGMRLFVRSTSDQGRALSRGFGMDEFAAVLNAATGRELFASVTNIGPSTFSPDDRWLAVARTNSVIEVLDASNGRHITDLSGHTNKISTLSFSRDGSLLASASLDHTVCLWRVPSGLPTGPPIRHADSVVRAVFSPDAKRLATVEVSLTTVSEGGKWCAIRTWDVSTGTEIGPTIKATYPVFMLAFDQASGRRLITGDNNNWVNVRDADSHAAILPPLTMESSAARCCVFSPDGLRFAVGSDDGTARVWNLETGESLTPRLRHIGWVESLQFHPDGTRLLTTSEDGTAKVWDLTTLSETAKPLQLERPVLPTDREMSASALSPDGSRFLVSLMDYTLRRVNLENLTQEGAPLATPDRAYAATMKFDSSGRQWAAALGPPLAILAMGAKGRSQSVGLWRREGDHIVHFSLPHGTDVLGIGFDATAESLFTYSRDKSWVWRTSDGSLKREASLPEQVQLDPAFRQDPGGSVVAVRTANDALQLFDLAASKWVGARIEARQVNRIQFSPDKTRFATAGSDGFGRIWDTQTGQPLTAPFKHGGILLSIEWSPDGRRVATSGLSPEAKLWDANTGESVLAPMVSKGSVGIARFSPDGRFLVTRCDDHTARVWDAATAEAVTPIHHHAAEVRAAMVTTKNRLVTVSDPAIIRAWDLTETRLPAEVITDYARLQAGRKLDRNGVLQKLSGAELGELDNALRSAHPDLFMLSGVRLREWYHRQVQEPTSLGRVAAGLFYLERCAELDPDNASLKEQQARFRACQIPPRDSASPANLVDLSDFYTHSIDVLKNQELADLPRGLQKMAGTLFDVRGIVRLEAVNSEYLIELTESFPHPEVKSIPVGRFCRSLQFLQGLEGLGKKDAAQDGDEVACWVIHFTDGSVREWPQIAGEHLRDWWSWPEISPKQAAKAVIAWEGHPPNVTKRGAENVRLFKATWTNPLPNVEVSHLDLVLVKASTRPFIVAISAE